MANLKEIRNRISSVSSTMQITSAMKMVSAAKLKKAQDAITATRPYAAKLTELLQNLSGAQDNESPYTTVRPVKRVVYVAITSNRGLCGGFNANIVKAVKAHAASNEKTMAVFSVGKKGNDILSKDFDFEGYETAIFDNLTYANAAELAQRLMDGFVNEAYDEALKLGAKGGKILGAGNGGFFLFFCDPLKHNSIINGLPGMKKFDFSFDETGSQIVYSD